MGFLFAILIAVIALIVYGSLYPWMFVARPLAASPFYVLLHTWEYDPASRRYWADIPVNASLWLLARSLLGLTGATVAIAIILAVVEVLQRYSTGHVPEITDPLLVVLLGLAFSVLRSRPPERRNG